MTVFTAMRLVGAASGTRSRRSRDPITERNRVRTHRKPDRGRISAASHQTGHKGAPRRPEMG
ncbi:hypothetical protein SGM_3967 [Streptomyces griseoaurantiacus M045]|uniref:Uncharacterized protein n=1 Tax=Streptomyces griseoaurantiacus M045 TaxID=996637 RepID=F3NLF3_9ACTN|nr:hypothetical protein SGM_3967 [Streptomyces griseoaurantiacus M045]